MIDNNFRMFIEGSLVDCNGGCSMIPQLGDVGAMRALSVRKRLDHRGPLSVDVSGAWYFITICAEGHKPWVATKWPKNNYGARSNAPALPRVIANWKHWLTARYGIAFQANFWDTRLRDEAHYAEKFRCVCNNPVRKGLCASAREWRPVIAFDRESGVERSHR